MEWDFLTGTKLKPRVVTLTNTLTMYYIIKSNHGNHRGYNRSWTLITTANDLNSARKELADQAIKRVEGCDGWILRNGRMWNTHAKEYLYTNEQMGFEEDLTYFKAVKSTEVEEFFNGGHNGYKPSYL